MVGLVLLSLYSGVRVARHFSREPIIARRAAAVVTLFGLVSIPAIYYFIDHWGKLFQEIHFAAIWSSMHGSLLSMAAALMLYYVWMLLVKIQYELLVAEKNSAWVRAMMEGD